MPNTTLAQLRDNPELLDTFASAVVEQGSVAGACRAMGLDRFSIWRLAHSNPELRAALWAARQAAAEKQYDECPEIADAATPETIQVARLQIDTRMRVAGKLMQSIYGEQATQTTQIVNNVGIVCDEATRGRLIAMREKMLLGGRPTTPALPDADTPEAD